MLWEKGAAVTLVPEQADKDPDFTTCPYPNPEKREAFRLAERYAAENGCDVILATDPDADRVGAMYRQGGAYTPLSGDEIGLMLCAALLKRKHENGVLLSGSILARSVVTMTLIDKICAAYGVTPAETLTGFKNICAPAVRLAAEGREALFIAGYEESNGICVGTYARDKDGICAALLLAELAAALKEKGLTFADYLTELYQTYGDCRSRLLTFHAPGLAGGKKISAAMDELRKNPPELEGLTLLRTRNFLRGIDGVSVSNVLQHDFSDGSRISFRPSGTEPLLKIYLQAAGGRHERTFAAMEAYVNAVAKKYF
jgi:phosphoglucomutase